MNPDATNIIAIRLPSSQEPRHCVPTLQPKVRAKLDRFPRVPSAPLSACLAPGHPCFPALPLPVHGADLGGVENLGPRILASGGPWLIGHEFDANLLQKLEAKLHLLCDLPLGSSPDPWSGRVDALARPAADPRAARPAALSAPARHALHQGR